MILDLLAFFRRGHRAPRCLQRFGLDGKIYKFNSSAETFQHYRARNKYILRKLCTAIPARGLLAIPKGKKILSEGSFLPGGKPKLRCWAATWSSGPPSPLWPACAQLGQLDGCAPQQPGSTSPQPLALNINVRLATSNGADPQRLQICGASEKARELCWFTPGEDEARGIENCSSNFRVWFVQFGTDHCGNSLRIILFVVPRRF